mgnify:CR=1 FL=1
MALPLKGNDIVEQMPMSLLESHWQLLIYIISKQNCDLSLKTFAQDLTSQLTLHHLIWIRIWLPQQ